MAYVLLSKNEELRSKARAIASDKEKSSVGINYHKRKVRCGEKPKCTYSNTPSHLKFSMNAVRIQSHEKHKWMIGESWQSDLRKTEVAGFPDIT